MKLVKIFFYTFLNQINLKFKTYLVGFAFLLTSLIAFGSYYNSFAQLASDQQGTVQITSSDIPSSSKKKLSINYSKTNASGTINLHFYTNYFPPTGTFSSVAGSEHHLPPCTDLGYDSLDKIGNSCMIKFPRNCADISSGAIPGTNCLNYSNIFQSYSSKKLKPIKCDGNKIDKINCLDTSNRPYCHEVSDPILGINCKLAPCTYIPNEKYRRPGVNCLADCNSSSDNTKIGNQISDDKFFMEGVNCLSSCQTQALEADKIIGQKCVYEFNKYVLPLCNNINPANFQHYNIAKTPTSPRKQCIDLKDLPICPPQVSSYHEGSNCTQICPSNPTSGYSHNINCVDKTVDRYCHHDPAQPSCNKINCSDLTSSELTLSTNKFNDDRTSDNAYCNAYNNYTSFSYNQLNTDPYSGYLKNYSLADMPCGSLGDTEQHMAILGSKYFTQSPTTSIDSTSTDANTFLNIIKNDCKSSGNSALGTNFGCDDNKITSSSSAYQKEFLYNTRNLCPQQSAIQAIRCIDYKLKPTTKPYDCNSSSMNYIQNPCPTGTPTCFCADSQEYCYKVNVDCTLSENNVYDICKQLANANYTPDREDDTVSWFFRPTIAFEALREISSGKYELKRMEGHPVEISNSSPDLNGNLSIPQWMIKDMGLINNGFFNSPISPSCQANKLGTRGIGLPYICGMKNNFRNIPSDEALYFKGEVNTIYGGNDSVDHRVTICIRSMNSGALSDTSCGWRKCRCDCTLVNCDGAWCGSDICRTVSVKSYQDGNRDSRPCFSDSEHFYYNNPNYAAIFSDPAIIGSYAVSFFSPIFLPMATLVSVSGLIKGSVEASSRTKPCMTTFQEPADNEMRLVRVRAFKPNPSLNYICAVSEHFGIATDISQVQHFFDGDEYFLVPIDNAPLHSSGKRLYQKLCVSGTFNNTSGKCENGFNTNDDKYNTHVWRTAKVVKYANHPPTLKDLGNENDESNNNIERVSQDKNEFIIKDYGIEYNDSGFNSKVNSINHTIGRVSINKPQLYEKSDCIKHSFRMSTPLMYGEADIYNSPKLFLPSIKINRICESGGANDCNNDLNSETDFFNPAILVSWGQISQTDTTPDSSPTSYKNYKIISINNNDEKSQEYTIIPYITGLTVNVNSISKKIFLKKNYDIDKNPTVCLYEKLNSSDETLIKCIPRKMAKIVSPIQVSFEKTSDETKRINVQMKYKINEQDFSLETSSISLPRITDFSNLENLKVCHNNLSNQGYPVCIARHKCTMLSIECVENERMLIIETNKVIAQQSQSLIRQYKEVSNYCKNNLLPECNKLKNLTPSAFNSTLHTSSVNGFNAPSQDNYYGWFNEICIVSGVEKLDNVLKKKYVLQYKLEDSLGKCVESEGLCSPQDELPNTENENQNPRLATPREMGLCIDIPNSDILQTCPPVNYGRNSDSSDPFWIANLTIPHTSHSLRSGTAHHAEFDVSFPQTTISGSCNGFWINSASGNPILSCNSRGEITVLNECIRYRCPSLQVPNYGADRFGEYSLEYDAIPNPLKSLRGFFHGYAKWNEVESGDTKKNVSSSSCIVGHKKQNSTRNSRSISSDPQIDTDIKNYYNSTNDNIKFLIESTYNKITGYTNGSTPTRNCNQLGKWEEVSNSCQRITCPSLDQLPKPSDAGAFEISSVIINNGNLITLSNSPYSTLDTLKKVKFTLSSSLSNSVIYLNPTNSSAYNFYPLKDENNNIITNILKNQAYVFELNGNSWKKLNNSKDEIYRKLWVKYGGASFPTGYAWRSTQFSYTTNPNDNNDKHIIDGTCQEDLGYRKLAGAPNPQLFCDNNGNWIISNMQNKCISDCTAVSDPIARDSSHGFSTWNMVSTAVGTTVIATSTACVNGYIKYPYDSPRDEEGNRGDFGLTNGLPSDASIADLGNTEYSFDGVATTLNGALFTASGLSESDSNFNGKYYNLKISKIGSSSGGISSTGEVNDYVFKLFNIGATQSITLQASTNTVWSKISFASYGTPNYSSFQNLLTSDCNQQYSKLIASHKCIGKKSCALQISDFRDYEPLQCESNISYGNGQNGIIASQNRYGSGGGAGGGNSLNPGKSGGQPGNNGENAESFCDENININNSCKAVLGSNAGLKVDLTQDSSSFDGKNGSAIIKYYNNDSCSGSPTTSNFSNIGINNYTVPGSSSNNYCIEYEITGAGGGGGGQGIQFGTDGKSGTKISGKFLAKGGKVIKIYIGEGGKAGKTGCVRNTFSSSSSIENYQENFDQIIIQKSKKFAYNSPSNNLFTKIFTKISDIFISESYAADCNWDVTGIGQVNLNNGSSQTFQCNDAYTGSMSFYCKSDCPKRICLYEHSYTGRSYCQDVYDSWVSTDLNGNNLGNDILSSMIAVGIDWVYYEHENMTGSSCTGSGSNKYENGSWQYSVTPNGNNGCGNDSASSIKFKASSCYTASTGSCQPVNCSFSDINLGSKIITFSTGYTTNGRQNCDTGYNGGYNYSCTRSGKSISGSCSVNNCTVPDGIGSTQRTISYNTTSLSCDKPNFNGTVSFNSCTSNGASLSIINNNCNCNSGYTLSGTNCVAQCSLNSAIGYIPASGLKVTGTGIVNCNQPNFNTSNTLSYNCSTSGSTINPSGSCDCISNYHLVGSTCKRKCPIPVSTNLGFTVISGDFAYDDLNGKKTYACSGVGYSTGSYAQYSCDSTGNLTFTPCTCSTGYNLNTLTKTCEPNECTSANQTKGINWINLDSPNKVGAKTNISCNVANFEGTFDYECRTGSNGQATITRNGCICSKGYALNTSVTPNACEPIKCTDSSGGTGYFAQSTYATSTLTYTPTLVNPEATGSFKCTKPGFYGNKQYKCKDNSPASMNGILQILSCSNPSDPLCNCIPVKCIMPESANSNASGSYLNPSWPTSIPAGWPTAGKIISDIIPYTCKDGYKQSGAGLTPSYQCEYELDSSNNSVYTTIINNPCVIVTCNVELLGQINYTPTPVDYDCKRFGENYYGIGSYSCDKNGLGQWVKKCKIVQCQIPKCTTCLSADPSSCPACSGVDQNSISDSQIVGYAPNETNLNCKRGYVFDQQPAYKCTYNSITQSSKLELSGSPCRILKCQANSDLKSIIDNTEVEWTKDLFVTTTCKSGYYQNPLGAPQYECDYLGNYKFKNYCLPITCIIDPSISLTYGMIPNSEVEWSNINKTIACSSYGFSGTITYQCNGVNQRYGTLTISSNNCKELVCDASSGGKNSQTFNNFVTQGIPANGGKGGGTNPVINDFNFLKGGNGGNSSGSFSSGSGGGGGQASMIVMDNDIIAIAGGGSGGSGGGAEAINSSTNFVPSYSNKLQSNIFGNYLVIKISNLGIYNSETDTAGLYYDYSSVDSITHGLNNGKLINDVIFASYGDPVLPSSLTTSPFNLKHGSCQTSGIQSFVEEKCLSSYQCQINNLGSSISSVCSNPKMGILSSYIFDEPKLNINGSGAYTIKEYNSNNNLVVANLEHDKVYSFVKIGENNSSSWIKFNYNISDEYQVKSSSNLNAFKATFHTTNSTFEPTLKIVKNSDNSIFSGSHMPIKKSATESLTINYIKAGTTYVLRNKGTYWEIKKYIPHHANLVQTRTFPKRVCTTLKLANNVITSWSGTDSTCINKCPSGEYDDRIGAGATLHETNRGIGKILWPEADFNTTIENKVFNSTPNANGIFEELTPEQINNIGPADFSQSNTNRSFFIVSRSCGADGVWSPPTYPCKISGSSNPPGSNNINLLTVGSEYAKQGQAIYSSCKSEFLQDNTGNVYEDNPKKPTPVYICTKPLSSKSDDTHLSKSSGDDCVKYCNTQDITNTSQKYIINYPGKNYKPNSSAILDCNTAGGYGNAFNSSGTRDATKKPTFTCSSNSIWGGIIINDCEPMRTCQISNLNVVKELKNVLTTTSKTVDSGSNTKFNIKNFLNPTNLGASTFVNHGFSKSFKWNCGYCTFGCNQNGSLSNEYYCYRSAFVDGVSCNDGQWVYNMYKGDWYWDRACDGDDYDYHGASEEDHPNSKYLGGCNDQGNYTKDLDGNCPDGAGYCSQ